MSDSRLEMRVAQLEQKVAELYRRMGEAEPTFDQVDEIGRLHRPTG